MKDRVLTPEELDDLDWMAKAELDHWHSSAESLKNRQKISEAILQLTAAIRKQDAEGPP